MTQVPVVDVHAHVLLPGVDEAVAGQPGLLAARELDARRNGPAALAVSGPMVASRITLLTDVPARLAAMDGAGVAVALSHLIFGGVFDRHPGLRIIAAHGGGNAADLLGLR